MARHGRAQMPWGKHKGTRLRLIPNEYLSWLTTTFVMRAPEWRWLKDSLIAELKFRDLRYDLADTPDEICKHCGKPEDDPLHAKYGPDLENPRKHPFELVPIPVRTANYTDGAPRRIQLESEP